MFPIDLVVTYCNSSDKDWQTNFLCFKNLEIQDGRANAKNPQAFSSCRTRNWDMFKYWFRCVDKNVKWINKVFLVVQNQNHIPDWIDINNPKLRIVYHNEFIPKTLLPTYNALTIQFFLSNIHDLSEHFIYSDDDFYFVNKINKTKLFTNNGIPIGKNTEYQRKNKNLAPLNIASATSVWGHISKNNWDFENKYYQIGDKTEHWDYHMPAARLKSFEQDIINQYNDEFMEAFSTSRFRNPSNFTASLFVDLLKITGNAIIENPYEKSKYFAIEPYTNLSELFTYEMVCLNDTETTPYSKKKEIQDLFEKHFPDKSSFEME